ncbi:PRY3 [Symbiodinium sp. CCMP2592]|nr:PRY3 [Symbiodinium sp. CCMP2592]
MQLDGCKRDYSVSGAIQGTREECLNADVACPCGQNAMTCGAGQESYCLPRLGLSRCPLVCPDGEEPCYRPSFDAQGNRLPAEETCVPIATGCGCGQGSFPCSTGQGEPECLPVGGYCPACAPGEIECPIVQNFFPDGMEDRMVPPSRQCAASLLDCPCGRGATMCAALNRCIFKGAACCAVDEKTCVVVDYTPDGNFTGSREICWASTAPCPCGANTQRCPGAELCLPALQKAAVCPCEQWQKACEITDYSTAGVPEMTWKVCVGREAPCPCGQNSLRCPDPLDANGTLCVAKVISGIASSCPTPCSQEELARGSQTCVQLDILSETVYIQRTSCLPFGLCDAGTPMKTCPSGAAIPVWQPCELGRSSRGNTSLEALEVATAIIPMDRLQTGATESLAAVGLQLQFLLEIPREMTTAISLTGKILSFAVTGPDRSGQLGSAERRLQGNAGTWEDPSDLILRLRDKAARGSPSLWQVLEPVGVPLAFASIDTQHVLLLPEEVEVDDQEADAESESQDKADVAVVVVITSLSICLLVSFCFLVWCLCKRKQRVVPESEDAKAQASSIPDGSDSRLAMISARFNGGTVEMQMRSVQKILAERNYRVLIVQAGAGDDFGDATLKYLHQIKEENGVILAVCTRDYAEVTSSQYSSHKELRYALDNDIEVVPLRVEDTYPPKPPFGEHHPHDQKGLGQALVQMKLPPSLVYLDCREKTSIQIASDVAGRLSSEKALVKMRSTTSRPRQAEGVDHPPIAIFVHETSEETIPQVSSIPDGVGSRLAMLSARFDRGPLMMQMRAVKELLTLRNYEVLMVDTDAGADVAETMMACLGRIQRESGIILAVCTWNYAEVSASHFSSYRELRFALDNSIEVLPLRVEQTYPPEPPWGGDHPYDQDGLGQTLVQIKLPPSVVPLDCRGKTALQIASAIAERLSSEKALQKQHSGLSKAGSSLLRDAGYPSESMAPRSFTSSPPLS